MTSESNRMYEMNKRQSLTEGVTNAPSVSAAPVPGFFSRAWRAVQLWQRRMHVYAVAGWVKLNYRWADQ